MSNEGHGLINRRGRAWGRVRTLASL